MLSSRRRLLPLGAAAALLAPAAARACAVCYGNAEAPVITGTRLSIVFMLALTYLLLAGIVFFFLFARRQRLRAAAAAPLAQPLASQRANEGPT
jgi:hypothetical protein